MRLFEVYLALRAYLRLVGGVNDGIDFGRLNVARLAKTAT
jgi:hypothetical protein